MDIRIIGLGNVLMGDDGFGPYVVRTLDAQFRFPPNVMLVDAGTPGVDLAAHVAGADVVIFVATINASLPLGTVRVYSRQELLLHGPQARLDPHDPGLKETILSLEFAGRAPRFVSLVGVVPERVVSKPGLSEAVRGAVPQAIQAVTAEVLRRDVSFTRRSPEPAPDIWWERPTRTDPADLDTATP